MTRRARASFGLRRVLGRRGLFRATRASAAVEFALLAPTMFLFMAGIVEIGRAYQVYTALNQLATRYAITWADCSDYPSGTCNTALATYASTTAMQNIAPQLTNTISLRMMQVQMSGTTPTIVYSTPAGTTLSAAETTAAQNAIASGQTGVIVTVSYIHTLVYFQKLMSPIFGNSASRTFTFTVAQDKS